MDEQEKTGKEVPSTSVVTWAAGECGVDFEFLPSPGNAMWLTGFLLKRRDDPAVTSGPFPLDGRDPQQLRQFVIEEAKKLLAP